MLVEALNTMEFGDFDMIPKNFSDDPLVVQELESLNITQLMIEVQSEYRPLV